MATADLSAEMPKKGKSSIKKDKGVDNNVSRQAESLSSGRTKEDTLLVKELDDLSSELEALKRQVKFRVIPSTWMEYRRTENQWLQEEAEKTKSESQDYQTYISRKSQKRQTLIISLTDQNRVQLQEIQKQKEDLLKACEEQKAELSGMLLYKENELSKVHAEIKTLEQYKALQIAQDQEIRCLERLLEDKKFEYENKIRMMKAKFLEEKKAYDIAMEEHVKATSDKANTEASKCFTDQMVKIRRENHDLRTELQSLIQITDELQAQKRQLEKQHKALIREHHFGQELQLKYSGNKSVSNEGSSADATSTSNRSTQANKI